MGDFYHYINRRHLELFLPAKTKDKKLHVFSKKEGYIGMKSYAKIAGAVDAYPEHVEKQMAVIEDRAIKTMRAICRGRKFDVAIPEQREQWYALLLYMALTACRHPDTVAGWRREAWEQIATHPLLLTHWRQMPVEDTLFEGLFNAVIPSIERPLWQLQWETLRIQKSNDLFAISDRCVDIAWAGRIGTPNDKSLVVMPVSKNIVLIGAKNIEVTRPIFLNLNVSVFNAVMYQRAHEYLFSTEKLDYEALGRNGRIVEYGVTMAREQRGLPEQPKIEIWAPLRQTH